MLALEVYAGKSLAEAEDEFAKEPAEEDADQTTGADGSKSTHYPVILDDDFESQGIAVGDIVRDSTTDMEFEVAGFTKDAMYGHISVTYISVDTYIELMFEINPTYIKHYHAVALEKANADLAIDGYSALTKAEVIDKLPGYKSEQMTIKMVDWMLVIITAVILAVFFFVINLQKKKEFGVMKAIGTGMGKLSAFVISEVGIIALFGAILAAVLVKAMAAGFPGTMPFYLQMQNVAMILAAFVLISLLGSLLSIMKIRKIDPAEIIGGDN